MELVLFLLLVYLIAFGGFWLLGLLYGLCRRPMVYFPARLAATMAGVGLAGLPLGLIGGVVLAAVVMDRAFAKREDYRTVPVVVVAVVMSVLVLLGTLLAAYLLAWEILE